MSMFNPKNLDDVRQFKREHKEKIMQQYQAEGVAIGKRHPNDDSYVIVVYLATPRNLPKKPVAVDGIPFQFEVTGQFKAQSQPDNAKSFMKEKEKKNK